MNLNNISEIKAEMLLNYLYPELGKKWVARYRGTFYRNYSQDSMEIDADNAEVELARDGFLRLLPQGLFTNEEELKKGDVTNNFKTLERRKHLLNELFLPFDNYTFHNNLDIERQVSELLESKLTYLLKEYFDYDITKETSSLVKEAATLLPCVSTWRGDFGFIRNLLEVLMKCEVNMTISRFSHVDTTICWLPKVRYDLLIPGLSPEQYRQKEKELQPLCDFLIERFIPFDVICEMRIKEHPNIPQSDIRLTLGYNTELKQ